MNEEESKALSIIAERSKISLENNASDKAAVSFFYLRQTLVL
ncbi:MAG TPA: hypothetical protein VGB02_19215 [Pyrinomonadaceae bacterium]|jgi:hypothetical protein